MATKSRTPAEPAIGAVEITVLKCRCRCGHEWIAKDNERPHVCPKCKSPRWDKPKLYERKRAE
jgi:Zn finger protein HypA/HybF involved in hydrogenase expression